MSSKLAAIALVLSAAAVAAQGGAAAVASQGGATLTTPARSAVAGVSAEEEAARRLDLFNDDFYCPQEKEGLDACVDKTCPNEEFDEDPTEWTESLDMADIAKNCDTSSCAILECEPIKCGIVETYKNLMANIARCKGCGAETDTAGKCALETLLAINFFLTCPVDYPPSQAVQDSCAGYRSDDGGGDGGNPDDDACYEKEAALEACVDKLCPDAEFSDDDPLSWADDLNVEGCDTSSCAILECDPIKCGIVETYQRNSKNVALCPGCEAEANTAGQCVLEQILEEDAGLTCTVDYPPTQAVQDSCAGSDGAATTAAGFFAAAAAVAAAAL